MSKQITNIMCIYKYTYTYIDMNIYICMHACMHASVHTYRYIQIYIYISIYTQFSEFNLHVSCWISAIGLQATAEGARVAGFDEAPSELCHRRSFGVFVTPKHGYQYQWTFLGYR